MGGGTGQGTLEGTQGSLRPGALSTLLRDLARAPESGQGEAWGDALRPGLAVGKFELVRRIGSGGFGVVWEARDTELGRSVAFKAVRVGRKMAAREESLLLEAEAVARLAHPNLVTLYDLGRSEHGPYLVLELLQGRTLEERLEQGRLSLGEAVHVATEVARGVAHAHARGVIHRDLKPSNVFLCDDGQVKVLDFGLAHAFGQVRHEGGTPAYMAPEQWEGAPEDERTDVFAMGVLLYRMLTGELPFPKEGGKPAHGGKARALEVEGLPKLGDLVGRMLAAQPVDRPRDGGRVLEALAAIGQEAARMPPADVPQVRTRWRMATRRVGLLAAGTALGVAIAAGGAWWAQRARRPPEPVALAVLPLANLSGDGAQEYLSDGITEDLTGKLARLGGLAVLRVRLSPEEEVSLRRWGTKNPAAYDEYLRGQALVEATSVREKMEAAQHRFERALELDPAFAPAMVGLALTESTAFRNFDPDPERVGRARALLDRALAIDPRVPGAYMASGVIKGVSYDYRGAAEDLRRATVEEPRNYFAWDALCMMLGYITPPEAIEAERACRRSLQFNLGFAEAYYHLTRVLAQQGRIAEAEQAMDYLAEQSPQSVMIPGGRFWIHLGANRPREALAVLAKVPGPLASSSLGMSWRTMALAQASDLDGAFAALEEALAKGWRDVDQMRLGPYLEPLRRDPRFARLLARYGIAVQPGAPGQAAAPGR